MVSFANAPDQNDFSSPIPHGTLSWAIIKIRPFNLEMGQVVTQSKSSEAQYLDLELTLMGGDHDKRKVFTKIGTYGKETYINMGRGAIRAILEVGRQASPQHPDRYDLKELENKEPDYLELDGLTIAIKIKVEKGTPQYPNDKNEVAVWLSPLSSATLKDFNRLLAGDCTPPVTVAPAGAAAAAPQGNLWGGGAAPANPALAAATGAPQQAAPAQTTAAPQAPWGGDRGTTAAQSQPPAQQPQAPAAAPGAPQGGPPNWLNK